MLNNHFFGLTRKEAEERLEEFGLNELRVKPNTPLWKKLLNQFTDLMVLILLGAAIISAGIAIYHHKTEELTEAYVILGIVILNALIGFIQEFKTEKALEALQKLVAPQARVIRAGTEKIIDAKELVPGDILILAEGDKITADCLLLEANELKIEESALTGESVPVFKSVSTQININENITELTHPLFNKYKNYKKENKIFMGTAIASGSGKALVVKTGMKTEFGQIAHLTATTKKDISPLQKELTRIGIFVGKVTFVISSILFLVGILIQGQSFIDSLLFSVSVAVAAVPEGLPATITIALAIGVQKMARKNAIIKQLSSVETLGSTTVICSDKTGTLTKNQMTVKQAYFPSGYGLAFQGTGYKPVGDVRIENLNKNTSLHIKGRNVLPHLNVIHKVHHEFIFDVKKMMKIISLCNDAKLVQKDHKWKILGDPTEGALLTAAHKTKIDNNHLDRIRDFPFDSVRKRMSVIVKDKDNKHELFVKGAPDSIIKQCSHILKEGIVTKINDENKKEIMKQNNSMADSALRVLAMAYKEITLKDVNHNKINKEKLENKLIFVGLIGMIDPPRDEVKSAVNLCHKAGIRTIIITGDYGNTALAVARDLNIASKNTRIVTGEELNKSNQTQLKNILINNHEIIFARVSPEHKMIIVDTLKKMGEIVAVTGDGVNDAPALKRADIGVSMGITGTDVSKEAANMILTDDSFASIVSAIKEGRIIYQNLRKFVWFIFSCNIGELVTIFSAIILQIPAPLTAVLILAIDLGTDVLPALALGVDPEEPGGMNIPPRNPKTRIMNKKFIGYFIYMGLTIGSIVVASYLYDLYNNGWSWGQELTLRSPIHLHAVTVAFATLVIIQMVNAFNARSTKHSVLRLKTNWYLWGSVILSILMVIAFVQIQFFQEKLHTIALTFEEWILVIIASLSVLIIEETRKYIMKVKNKIINKSSALT